MPRMDKPEFKLDQANPLEPNEAGPKMIAKNEAVPKISAKNKVVPKVERLEARPKERERVPTQGTPMNTSLESSYFYLSELLHNLVFLK